MQAHDRRKRSRASRAALVLALGTCLALTDAAGVAPEPQFMLVVHGGVGTIRKAEMTTQDEAAYREALSRALRAGYDVLSTGGTSLDAVEAALVILEDSPLFNAGKGAVFTNAGTVELDASIMDGRTLNAGAVAGVQHVRNPIRLARQVMERSRHVLLAREGAEAFAKEIGMELVDRDYFFTPRRWEQLQRAKEAEEKAGGSGSSGRSERDRERKHGTVGAVALDVHGNLAAGTSTGGLTNKHWGRIGDSPIVGAGTYADNASCAVSGTGTGEYFIRHAVAHDICARVQYLGASVQQAADSVILGILGRQNVDGGVIVLDRAGRSAIAFNTDGMYRGWVGPDGKVVVKMYRE